MYIVQAEYNSIHFFELEEKRAADPDALTVNCRIGVSIVSASVPEILDMTNSFDRLCWIICMPAYAAPAPARSAAMDAKILNSGEDGGVLSIGLCFLIRLSLLPRA